MLIFGLRGRTRRENIIGFWKWTTITRGSVEFGGDKGGGGEEDSDRLSCFGEWGIIMVVGEIFPV